jgi:hypothetical protein
MLISNNAKGSHWSTTEILFQTTLKLPVLSDSN